LVVGIQGTKLLPSIQITPPRFFSILGNPKTYYAGLVWIAIKFICVMALGLDHEIYLVLTVELSLYVLVALSSSVVFIRVLIGLNKTYKTVKLRGSDERFNTVRNVLIAQTLSADPRQLERDNTLNGELLVGEFMIC
jgi:hypothetical protein